MSNEKLIYALRLNSVIISGLSSSCGANLEIASVLVKAANALEDEGDWADIASAPTDGTRIIVGNDLKQWTAQAYYCDEEGRKAGWYNTGTHPDEGGEPLPSPTHWRHTHKPPKRES